MNNTLTPWEARQIINGYKHGLKFLIERINEEASLEQIDKFTDQIVDIANEIQEVIRRSKTTSQNHAETLGE